MAMASNANLDVGDIIGAQGPEFPSTIKCEFCDVTFKCDLDVSRHLTSDIHKKNKHNFDQNYSQKENNNRPRKEAPKNVSQVLQLLKIKNVKDIEHLEDRRYFRITNDTQATLASEVARCLLKSFIINSTKDLPPEVRQELAEAASVEKEEANKPVEKQAASSAPPPVAPLAGPPPPVPHVSTPRPAQATKAHQPQPSQGPAKSSSRAQKPPPEEVSTSAPKPKPAASKETPSVPSNLVPRPSKTLAPQSVHAARQQAATSKQRINLPATPAPPPTSSRLARAGPSVTAQPLRVSPTTAGSSLLARPLSRAPTLAPAAAAGASTAPNRTPEQQPNQGGPPQPKKDSDYVPKLAIIKVEPKD